MDFEVFLPTYGKNLQRPYVWTEIQEKELIDSIILGRSIPPIRYVSLINPEDEKKDLIQIIDGKQRLTAMIKFAEDKFSIKIQDKEFFYSQLPDDFKNHIDNFYIVGEAMYQHYNSQDQIIPITDDTKLKWFKLINFSGTPQDKNHINSFIL